MESVDFGTDTTVADIRVNGIGEIYRCRAARQGDQAAVWRKTEHLVMKQFELGVLKKLLRVIAFEQHIHQAAQPLIGIAFIGPEGFTGDNFPIAIFPAHLPCRERAPPHHTRQFYAFVPFGSAVQRAGGADR